MRTLHFETIDSTMFEAERRAQSRPAGMLLLHADAQTGGHGRHGRVWQSPIGNLYWTMLMATDPPWPRDHGLSFAAALAVREALCEVGVHSERIRLKWPNDALVDGRKISGILVRTVTVVDGGKPIPYAIAGIGINVALFPSDATYPATSLAAEGYAVVTVPEMRDALTRAFVDRVAQWRASGLKGLMPSYLSVMHGLNQTIRASRTADRSDIATGINRGIDPDGALCLEQVDGSVVKLLAADVLPPI